MSESEAILPPKTISLASVKPNPNNPRYISEKEYKELVKSIKRDFLFLEEERLLHADGIWWSGNQRSRALTELSRDKKWVAKVRKHYGDIPDGHIPADWTSDISRFSDEEKHRLAVLANSPGGVSGAWNWDALANLPEWSDMPELEAWGLAPETGEGEGEGKPTDEKCTCPNCGKAHKTKG